MQRSKQKSCATLAAALIICGTQASFGQDQFMGTIEWTGSSFCRYGTLPADGRVLPIAQYTALYSLFGTYYGGDGRVTFALPDLQNRVLLSAGQATNSGVQQGQVIGGIGCPKGAICEPRVPDGLALRACVVTLGIYPQRQ